jgi:hypothetical protein
LAGFLLTNKIGTIGGLMLSKRTKNHRAPDLSEKRRETRYPLEVEAIIFCGGEIFFTTTLNISGGGLQIIDSAPEQFGGKKVEIQIASDMNHPKKFETHYGILVDENRNRLKFYQENSI